MTSYLIAGPEEEPVSLDEAKGACGIADNDEDALISALIAAARLHVEIVTSRALIAQTWRLVQRVRTEGVVYLPVVPVMRVLDAPNGAVCDGDRVVLATPIDELHIDYIAGYGDARDVPNDLKQAVLALVRFWYEHRDTTPYGF